MEIYWFSFKWGNFIRFHSVFFLKYFNCLKLYFLIDWIFDRIYSFISTRVFIFVFIFLIINFLFHQILLFICKFCWYFLRSFLQILYFLTYFLLFCLRINIQNFKSIFDKIFLYFVIKWSISCETWSMIYFKENRFIKLID